MDRLLICLFLGLIGCVRPLGCVFMGYSFHLLALNELLLEL